MAALRLFLATIGFICLTICEALINGDVKLTGDTPGRGTVMVYYRYRYGYVCDDGFGPSEGQAACRNLNRTYVTFRKGIKGSGVFVLDDIDCIGTESNLDQCKHRRWGSEDCGTSEHVFLECGLLPCDSHNCSQLCENVDNSPRICSCRPGYVLDADGQTCNDIDECLSDNGGCSHTCVNTPGSHYCECPRYLYLSGDNSTCTADGFTVDCTSSFGMTIIMDKTTFFFLPDALTLTNTSCTSQSNSTHVWLYTDYNACSTVRKVVGNEIIYSNAVLDSKTSVGGIRFFDSIKIPFQCRLSANRTISQGLSPVASQLIMRVDGNGHLNSRFLLLNGVQDSSPELPTYDIKQGSLVHVKYFPSIDGVSAQPQRCDALSMDNARSQNLISNGQPSNFLTKILPSNHYRFSYPVFTFGSGGKQIRLTCHANLAFNSSTLNAVNKTLIVTPGEASAAAKQTPNSIADPVARVVDTTQGVDLQCKRNAMILTLDPSVTVGLSIQDLQPLKENCFGFYATVENGSFVYSVPLTHCGAEIKKDGTRVTFTNSLVYASNMVSKVKYFSQVILTHSCSYPLTDIVNSLTYTVRSNNFAFGAENKQKANFDVSLNVFSDNKFKQLLNNGGAVSISEGRHLFGDIGVTSSDPNLKVALNDCKVTPTNNPNDPNSHIVIRNGCKTAYGVRVFSPEKFSILTRSFVDHRGQNVFLHCSVVVCGSNNMNRCLRKCTGSDVVVGKREVESTDMVHVSAGPFLIQ